MNTSRSTADDRSAEYPVFLFPALLAAGLIGNSIHFSILNAHFIFGSIFAMLALQLFGWRRGVLAAAVISSYTYWAWNHPWAMVTMTMEVAVVGLILGRRNIHLVTADALYWFLFGIPVGYFCFHLISDYAVSNTLFLMTKQAINGIANALMARLVFTACSRRIHAAPLSLREVVSNLLLFFVLCPFLIILAVCSRADMDETNRRIRTGLMLDSRHLNDSLENWIGDRERTIVHLAEMAVALSPLQMQQRMDQARMSDTHFLRIGLLDKDSTLIASSPPADNEGRSNIGRSFADRSYIPLIKDGLKPMLSDVVVSRFGSPEPIAVMLAPVLSEGDYNGLVGGVLNFDRLMTILKIHAEGQEIRYTLVDRNGNVIVTNRPGQEAMAPYSRGEGTLHPLDNGISQWIPVLPRHTSTIEFWGQSVYIVESTIGDPAQWKLVIEQPVAPYQQRLYESYTRRLFVLFPILLAGLVLSELLSRRIVGTIDELRRLTQDMPTRLMSGSIITWPGNTIIETKHLVDNFKAMAELLKAKFIENRQIHESLEQRVEERTRELRDSEALFKNLFEHHAAIKLIIDPITGNIIDANQAAADFYGWSRERLKRMMIQQINTLSPEQIKKEMEKARAKKQIHFEFQHRRADGSIRDVAVFTSKIEAKGKDLLHSIVQDITEHKQAEQALRENEALLSALFESSPTGLILIDEETRVIVQANAHAANLVGRPKEEITGRICHEFMCPAECNRCPVLDLGEEVDCSERLLLRADGNRIPIFKSVVRIRFRGKNYLFESFIDITERKRMERVQIRRSRRTQTLLDLFEMSDRPTSEIVASAIDALVGLTESRIGFLGFVDESESTMFTHLYSKQAMQECAIDDRPVQFDLSGGGLWTAAVKLHEPVIINDYSDAHPFKKGFPEGHVRLTRYLGVPLVRDGRTLLLAGLANKEEEYREEDLVEATLFLEGLWGILGRKRAEEELLRSRQGLEAVMDSMDALAYVADMQTHELLFLNKYGHEINPGFAPGSRCYDLFQVGQEGPCSFCTNDRLVDDRGLPTGTCRWEFRNTKTGRWYDCRDQAIRWSDGRLVRLEIATDITERKQAEAERERLIAAVEQAGEVFLVTDASGIIQYVNPAFEKVTGYTRDEAIDNTPGILKSGMHDEAFYRDLWGTISSGRTWKGRIVNKRRDGALYTEDVAISPVYDASNQIVNYVAVKRDVTEHLRLAEQLEQAQRLESVGRLAGGVAHDFNNMLGVILGRAELALERVEPGHPLEVDLQEILHAAGRSAEITRQLLAFARKQTIAPVVLDLNETVEGMLRMIRRLIGEDIDLAWLPRTGLWPVRMDPSQLDQVLANLCVNARDAIHGVGKVTIETDRVVFDEAYCADHPDFVPGRYVMLAVSDDGCGMDGETLDRIFEPFFTTKEAGRGTGLGLSTVHGIVRQNGGFIHVYSEPGKGTTFRIYLPPCEDEERQTQAAGSEEMPLGRGETVLVVEDDESILKMTQTMLERLGYRVLAAGTTAEAERLSEEYSGEIHLLITDVIMPGMNGRDLAERCRAARPGMKCLFMSGYTANVIAHQAVLDEGVHFIQKPFSMEELAGKVRETLH